MRMTLLTHLSDEELDQYQRLAHDQMERENRFDWAQVAVGILAAAALAWTFVVTLQNGLDRGRLAVAGLAGLTLYWPYRKAKARRIWSDHITATEEEQARRESQKSRGEAA